MDAGEAENVRQAVETSDRYDCWREHCERVSYAGFFAPNSSRRVEVLEALCANYELPCRPG